MKLQLREIFQVTGMHLPVSYSIPLSELEDVHGYTFAEPIAVEGEFVNRAGIVTLNYQVSCTYKPNGSGTTRTAYVKNMGWHFARYGGVAHADEPLYCIEPWRNYAASTSGNGT